MISRRPLAALLAVALGGFLLRLLSLTGAGGPLGAPAGYDDGVYFSASALLARGVLPYRDFVFVHPPGILYFYLPLSWLPDAATAFAIARVVATLVGAINVFLAGRIVLRAAGPVAAVVASLLYALYPDALGVEKTTFLEPVLNLAALAAADVWLGSPRPRRPVVAGLLAGAACVVKLWGGIWVVAALVSSTSRKEALRFVAAAAAAGALLLAPVALPSPSRFIAQTVQLQLSRPPDGLTDAALRLREIADSGHRAATVLAVIALLSIALRVRTSNREERFFAVAALLTVAGFVASSSYWNQYNAHLAASQCVLAGFGVAALTRMPRKAIGVAVAALILALDFPSIRDTLRNLRVASPELAAARHTIPAVVPPRVPLFAFDPTLPLVAGHLPPHGDGAPVIVDSYGAMLLNAVQQRGRFRDTEAALRSDAAQREVRARLAASRYVLLGWRGNWQLNDADRAWFFAHFECANPEAGEVCVWQRVARASGPVSFESERIEFREGWYAEEGTRPKSWRWMSGRSVTTLPARRGDARLELAFDIPLRSLGAAPSVGIELDGVPIDRFVADERRVARGWTLRALRGDAPHTLVITTDRTFTPSRSGHSADTRELGVSLTDITWRRAGGGSTSN